MGKRGKLPGDHGDPRGDRGKIVGDTDDPYAHDSVVIDATNAVLLDGMYAAAIAPVRQGNVEEASMAVQLDGRINKTDDRSSVLYLMNADGAGALVAEVLGLAARMGTPWMETVLERVGKVPK